MTEGLCETKDFSGEDYMLNAFKEIDDETFLEGRNSTVWDARQLSQPADHKKKRNRTHKSTLSCSCETFENVTTLDSNTYPRTYTEVFCNANTKNNLCRGKSKCKEYYKVRNNFYELSETFTFQDAHFIQLRDLGRADHGVVSMIF